MSTTEEELDPSALGTKTYWDDLYKVELENYKDHEDVGEIWFGMESVRRIVRWMSSNITDKSSSILDLGCGNGMTLVELEEEGYDNLAGVDYSQAAVDLASSLSNDNNITYQSGDLLDLTSAEILQKKYKVLVDKGTYDAISLSPDDSKSKRHTYIDNVHKLLEVGGVCCITSCNWTSSEITHHFTNNSKFTLKQEVPVKQYQFGGKVGQTVCCLIFEAV